MTFTITVLINKPNFHIYFNFLTSWTHANPSSGYSTDHQLSAERDTLVGFLNHRLWWRSSERCRFKQPDLPAWLTRKPVHDGTFVRFSLGGKIDGKLHFTVQFSAAEETQTHTQTHRKSLKWDQSCVSAITSYLSCSKTFCWPPAHLLEDTCVRAIVDLHTKQWTSSSSPCSLTQMIYWRTSYL